MFKRKYKVVLLDEKWNILYSNVSFIHLPRKDEYIFIAKDNKYFLVLNIVHSPENNKDNIFIVIKELDYQLNITL